MTRKRGSRSVFTDTGRRRPPEKVHHDQDMFFPSEPAPTGGLAYEGAHSLVAEIFRREWIRTVMQTQTAYYIKGEGANKRRA